MSRNFEILERAARERQSTNSVARITIREPLRPELDPHALSRTELLKLVQRIFLLPNDQSRTIVAFAGIQDSTGCSSICAGVGEALAAHVDGPVCLVDANLRRPGLHRYFNVNNLRGLSDAITSQTPIREFLQKLPGGRLRLLSSGSLGSNVSPGLNTEQLRSRFSELRKEFAYVLVDSPSLNGCTEAIMLGKLADGVILVLESNTTRREVARIAKENIESAGVRLLGAVLNKRTFPIPRFLYDRL